MNAVEEVNRRFNEELEIFAKGKQVTDLHLGKPGEILLASGLQDKEIYITPKTLKKHFVKHGFTVDDIKDLPGAMDNPLLVYEWGENAKSLIVITQKCFGEDKVAAAIKLERKGERLQVNELAGIHPKAVQRFMQEMSAAKGGGLQEALRYVPEKKKVLDWLGLVPPKGTASLTRQELSIAKIVQNFQNPPLKNQKTMEKVEQEIKHEVEEARYNNGQLAWRQEYKNGLMDGLYEAWHENGQLGCRFRCKNDKKDGLYETWNPNGQLDSRARYKNGNLEGLQETWDSKGKLATRTFFKEGKVEGVKEMFYSTGQLVARQEYRNGLMDGLYETWYMNGQRKWRCHWKNGREDGLYEAWHENGQLSERMLYKEGEREGLRETWHENGSLSCRMTFKDGKIEGLREDWHENGRPLFRVNYKGDLLDGLSESWHDNGKLASREYYKNNRKHGLCEEWGRNGRLIEKSVYENGIKVPQIKKQAVSPKKRCLGL